jgi:hypothetical protein
MSAKLKSGTRPCAGCGKPIGVAGHRTRCTSCYRALAATPKLKPAPKPVERRDFTQAWGWLVANGPVAKSDLVRRVCGHAKSVECTLTTLENNGYLLSENERGLVYAFERKN